MTLPLVDDRIPVEAKKEEDKDQDGEKAMDLCRSMRKNHHHVFTSVGQNPVSKHISFNLFVLCKEIFGERSHTTFKKSCCVACKEKPFDHTE